MKHKLQIKETAVGASHAQITDGAGGPVALSASYRPIKARYWEGNKRPAEDDVKRKVPVVGLITIPDGGAVEIVSTNKQGVFFPQPPVLTAKVTNGVLSARMCEVARRRKDNDNKPTRARLRKISTANDSPIILWIRDRIRLVLKKTP